MRTSLVVLAVVLASPAPAWGAWRRPVSGAVARPFAYSSETPFRAGAHRGADLAAPAGAPVRAPCSGAVVTASMSVVTLRCGEWRVTALPLESLAVREGARLRAGAVIGRLGTMPGHTGLHLGVRRAGDRFAYVDPVPLLGDPSAPPVTAVPRSGPRPAPPAGVAPPRPAPAPADAPPRAPAPAPRPAPAPGGSAPAFAAPAPRRFAPPLAAPAPRGSTAAHFGKVRVSAREPAGGLAPWPAWAGLALLALGAVGGGLKLRARGRLATLAEPATERVPSAT